MENVILKIEHQSECLMLTADTTSLGSQHDNETRRMIFERPKKNENDDLILFFSTEYENFIPQNIERDNEFIVSDSLTKQTKLRLQIAFMNDTQIMHSNIIDFSLRPSLHEGSYPADSIEHPKADSTCIPVGGLPGQVLAKRTATDFDTEWVNQTGEKSDTSNHAALSNLGYAQSGHTGFASTADLSLKADKIALTTHEADQIRHITENEKNAIASIGCKLDASNIKAGTNISVQTNGSDIIINSNGDISAVESDIAWLPNILENGDLSWERSNTTTAPATCNIKGKDGSGAKINGFETLDIIDSDTVTAEIDTEAKTIKFTSLLTGTALPRIDLTLSTYDELNENGDETISIRADGGTKQFAKTNSDGIFTNKFIKTETTYTFAVEHTNDMLADKTFRLPSCQVTTGTLDLPIDVKLQYIRNDLSNPCYLDNIREVIQKNSLIATDIHIETFENLAGTHKWVGGTLAPNGKIYGIPSTSNSILEIDPETKTATTFGSLGSDANKWIGGVLAPNGKIYGIPFSSNSILEIDPNTRTAATFGSLTGSDKYSGGVLAPNGKIYGIPYSANSILEIDPETKTITTFSSSPGINLSSAGKWAHGALAPNGKIYMIPSDSTFILEFDPETKNMTAFGELSNVTLKWSVGVLASNGKIYGIPYNSDSILEINPETRATITFGNLGNDSVKWSGGILAPNGKIYGVPYRSSFILEIDSESKTTITLGDLGNGNAKWHGGVLAQNGKIYGIPRSSASILELELSNLINFGITSLHSVWINKSC